MTTLSHVQESAQKDEFVTEGAYHSPMVVALDHYSELPLLLYIYVRRMDTIFSILPSRHE